MQHARNADVGDIFELAENFRRKIFARHWLSHNCVCGGILRFAHALDIQRKSVARNFQRIRSGRPRLARSAYETLFDDRHSRPFT